MTGPAERFQAIENAIGGVSVVLAVVAVLQLLTLVTVIVGFIAIG